jgi:hypothetical protein
MGKPKTIAIIAILCLVVGLLATARYVTAAPQDRPVLELLLGLGALACATFLTVRAVQVAREEPGGDGSTRRQRESLQRRLWFAAIAGSVIGAATGAASGLSVGWSPGGVVAFAGGLAVLSGGISFLMFWIGQRR